MSKDDARLRGNIGIKLAVTLALLTIPGVVVGFGTVSAFSSIMSNQGNSFETGTVVISANDDLHGAGPVATAPILSFESAKRGASESSCITVSYAGMVPGSLRLYGTTSGTGLDRYLNVTVTRGSGAAGFDDCAGFTADSTDYDGAGPNGNGVIYNGTLQGFPDAYDASALVDPTSISPEVWTKNETHVYKVDVTVQDNSAAKGKTAAQTFSWEARTT